MDEDNNYLQDYSNLPTEIVQEIFQHLSFSDLQSAASTCSRWLLASSTSKIRIKFSKRTKSRTFYKSQRCFQNICFESVPFQHVHEILLHIELAYIKSIKFLRINLSCYELLEMFHLIGSPNELIFINSSISGEFPEEIRYFLESISYFESSGLMGSATIEILSSLRNLKGLIISDTNIPEDLFGDVVLENAKTLKELVFFKTIDFGIISNLQNLDKVVLPQNEKVLTHLESIAKSNKKLKHIELEYMYSSFDDYIDIFTSSLMYLETLSLQDCIELSDSVLEAISKIQTLRSLNISSCWNLTAEGISNAFGQHTNYNISELFMDKVPLDEPTLCRCITNCPNLKLLSLASVAKAVTTLTVQKIIKCLHRLQHLNLANCSQITDISLLGTAEEGFNINRLNNLIYLNLEGTAVSGNFLSRGLQFSSLRQLVLSDCTNIEYFGVKEFAQNCPSIEKLELVRCKNLTDDAVEVIVSELKRLRYLNLNGCINLTVCSVDAIAGKCKSLKILSIYDISIESTDHVICRLSVIPSLQVVY